MILAIESVYSFNGSLIKENTIEKLNSYNYQALGLVDYSTAFFYSFYNKVKTYSIKPILGLRVNVGAFDIILYPLNFNGYKEVLKYASTINSKEVNDYKAIYKSSNIMYVIDVSLINKNDINKLQDIYDYFVNTKVRVLMGVDFNNSICRDSIYNIVRDMCPTIIISKVKYLDKENKVASDILKSIIDKVKYEEKEDNAYYMHTKDELFSMYKDYPDLINRTKSFIDMVNIDITNKGSIPIFNNGSNVDSKTYLKALAHAGLRKRIETKFVNYKEYNDRLDYELSIIDRMGFNDYFLIVYDYILYSKKNNIFVGPGRGSSASSLVAYSLGITEIDPIEYGLFFERFLNPDRVSMPDIDTDIEDTRREDVINYCVNKYGENHVALTCVYQTYKAKSVLKDIGDVLNISSNRIDSLIKEVPSENTISSLTQNKNMENFYNSDSIYKTLIESALLIEGAPQNQVVHPSGVILSRDDINDYSETHKGSNGLSITTYDADIIEKEGLLKMDFLSMPTLSFMHNVINDIKINKGIEIDVKNIDLEDKDTYKMIREESLKGIFQLETNLMSDLVKRMGANSFSDLSICIALNRPGPKDSINTYLLRREGKEEVTYYDESIKDILKDTLGIIVYQEQLMAIARVYSGFSLAEADLLRKAISSKDVDAFNNMKTKFFDGALRLNRNSKVTEIIFNDISKFAGYGLNKSHAVSYSYMLFILAFLKCHFKEEFLSNMLSSQLTFDSIKECLAFKVPINGPDLINSNVNYVIVDKKIYLPFTSIKGIGEDYANKIIALRDGGVKTFEEFVSTSKEYLPKSVIEQMIYAGCFNYTGYTIKMMIMSLDGLYEFGSLNIINYKIRKTTEFSFDYLREKELNVLGFNLKYHPIKLYNGNLKKVSDLDKDVNDRIVGYVSSVKEFRTKSNELMVHLNIEDEFKSIKGVLFNNDYLRYKDMLKSSHLYEIYGSYKEVEEEIVIRELKRIDV